MNLTKNLLLAMTLSVAISLSASADQKTTIEQFALEGPAFMPGKSLDAIYGLADEYSEEIKKVEIQPSGRMIEFHTVFFDGLQIYGFVRSEKEFAPLAITITHTRWRVAHELNVGSAIDEVQKTLGEPNEINDDGFIYRAKTGEVVFQYVDGVVTKVVFNYHAD